MPIAHGLTELSREGQVVLMRLSGTSNLEAAEARKQAFLALWQAWCEREGAPSRWALLVDMQDWQGVTPEGFGASGETLQWAISHGLVATACVMPDTFMRRLVIRHLERGPSARYACFADLRAARQWLRDEGFVLGPDAA